MLIFAVKKFFISCFFLKMKYSDDNTFRNTSIIYIPRFCTLPEREESTIQIRFFSREGSYENRFHFHDQMEILLSMSEGGSFYIRNTIYPITRGSLFIFSPDDIHHSESRSSALSQFYSIRFYPEEVSSFSTDTFDVLSCFKNHEHFNFRVQLHGDQLDHLLKLINKMEYYVSIDCSAYGKEIFTKTLLAETLVYINFLYNVSVQPSPQDNKALSDLMPVINYIHEHISEPLSLSVLSKQVFVSPYYLSHRFKEIVGITLSECILACRISQAKTLLRQGCSVSMAGERSGFNSTAHFIRVFVKAVGISPKQYAKQDPAIENYASPSPVHRDAFHAVPGQSGREESSPG